MSSYFVIWLKYSIKGRIIQRKVASSTFVIENLTFFEFITHSGNTFDPPKERFANRQ
jgi:hypothetical protein